MLSEENETFSGKKKKEERERRKNRILGSERKGGGYFGRKGAKSFAASAMMEVPRRHI